MALSERSVCSAVICYAAKIEGNKNEHILEIMKNLLKKYILLKLNKFHFWTVSYCHVMCLTKYVVNKHLYLFKLSVSRKTYLQNINWTFVNTV